MLTKCISIMLFLAMVHSIVYMTLVQYKEIEVSIVIVEEDENSQSENSSKQSEKLYEYIIAGYKNYVNLNTKAVELNQQSCYFLLHHKDSGKTPPPDNPPEV